MENNVTSFGPNKWRLSRLFSVLRQISVEPILFLSLLCLSMDKITVQQLLLFKSCRIDFAFSDEICENLVEHEIENSLVQNEIAQFTVYMKLVDNLFPSVLCFYFGAWCDLIGRKTILYSTLIGQLLAVLLLLANVLYMESWPKEIYLCTVLVPSLIFGPFSSLKMAVNAFITDITPPESRLKRLGVAHLIGYLGRPTGSFLSGFLLSKFGYIVPIAISASCQILALLYTYYMLTQYSWSHQSKKTQSLWSYISPIVLKDSLILIFKKRPHNTHLTLYLLYSISFLTLSTSFLERELNYNVVRTRYEWNVQNYSLYSGISQSYSLLSQTLILPLLSHFQMVESLTLNFVLLSLFCRYLIKAFGSSSLIFYIGDFVDFFGSYSSPILHSYMASQVSSQDIGRIYTLYSSLENIVPILSSPLGAFIWKRSSTEFPGLIFLCLTLCMFVSLLFGLLLFCRSRSRKKDGTDFYVTHM